MSFEEHLKVVTAVTNMLL